MVLFGTVITSGFWLEGCSSFSTKADLPNIVLIYVDDLGYKDLESYGNEYFETPRIDSLLASGLRFTQAYSNAPLCAPSRIALLTGRHSARSGAYEVVNKSWNEVNYFLNVEKMNPDELNVDWEEKVNYEPPFNNLDLPEGRKVIPEYLKEIGYFTGFFGKWHVGPQKPTDRGFDEYVELRNINSGGSHLDVRKGFVSKSPEYPEPYGQSGDYMTDISLHFIDRAEGRPFFLYMAHPLIHLPIEAEKGLIEKYEMKPSTLLHSHPVYAAMVEELDNSVGALVEGLKHREMLDNTIIIFTSDNGGMTGTVIKTPELGGFELGEFTTHYPLRGGKVQLWEGGIRVPMGVVFGENFSRGTFDGLVTQMDILPTLLDVTGHPDFNQVKEEFDGKSLQSILIDPMSTWEERSLVWHYPGYRGMTFKPAFEGQGAGFDQRPETAIRRGRWKMIKSLETGKIQLYDLYSDLPETRNVSYATFPYSRFHKNIQNA